MLVPAVADRGLRLADPAGGSRTGFDLGERDEDIDNGAGIELGNRVAPRPVRDAQGFLGVGDWPVLRLGKTGEGEVAPARPTGGTIPASTAATACTSSH
ncbi:hypothetical protein ACFWUZ_34285 [Streptomyces sp. NPDC058646]|uniref:hypothetical protein n=1 Tax=Streptomyces sp. NPDC058646 TaxID=3346574 RepID=UPI003666C909